MQYPPTISILIPTYQYARYLPEALDSVLEQDFDDFDILISDDCSRDGSQELIRAYARRDKRIRFKLHDQNLGMVQNWNWCLSEARGQKIKFLFGDDRLGSRDALGVQHSMLEANPGISLATSSRRLIDEQSKTIGYWNDLGSSARNAGQAVGRECLLRMQNLIGEPSAVMFRRSDLPGLFDPRYRQIVDLEMWLQLLKKGDLAHSSRAFCEFRRHSAQATEGNAKLKIGFSEYSMLFRDHLDYFLPESLPLDSRIMRHMYSVVHYARKKSREDRYAQELADAFRVRIGETRFKRYSLQFALMRPCVNLGLSLHKRISRRRLSWSFAEGWRWGLHKSN